MFNQDKRPLYQLDLSDREIPLLIVGTVDGEQFTKFLDRTKGGGYSLQGYDPVQWRKMGVEIISASFGLEKEITVEQEVILKIHRKMQTMWEIVTKRETWLNPLIASHVDH